LEVSKLMDLVRVARNYFGFVKLKKLEMFEVWFKLRMKNENGWTVFTIRPFLKIEIYVYSLSERQNILFQ
jgi:hypothetical protein